MMVQGGLKAFGFNANRLLSWWGGELSGLLPERLKALLGRQRSVLWLTCRHQRFQAFAAGALSQPLLLARARHQTSVLLLPDKLCLQHQVELPLSVEAELDQVMRFELDRLTPFTPEQAYYDCRVLNRDLQRRVLKLELLLSPRAGADALLKQLAKQGIQPQQMTRLDRAGQPLPFNLLPRERRPRQYRFAVWLNTGLAVLSVLLLAVWLLRPLQHSQEQLELLQPAVEEARSAAEASRRLKQQIEALRRSGEFLAELQQGHVSPLELLKELTVILPDDTWLQQLQLRADEVTVQGQAPAAAQVVQLLESSPLLHSVTFRSPVVRDVRTGHESFFLSARLGERTP